MKDIFLQSPELRGSYLRFPAHCGNTVAGNITGLANQIIVGLNLAAVAEVFTMVK